MILQPVIPHQILFRQQTDTFDLTVSLANSKLTLILQNFIEWAIYSKEYTQEDIGKEINKKMSLADVYNAFSRAQHEQKGYMKTKQSKDRNYYQHGANKENLKLPCYKVDSEGQIPLYLNAIEKYSKKQVICESKLMLTKERNMTGKEISLQKSKKPKIRNLKDPINQQEQREKQQQLLRRFTGLQQENARLREQLKITKYEMIQKFQQLESSIHSSIYQTLRVFKEEQNEKNERYQEKITQLNHRDQREKQRIADIFQNFSQKLAEANQRITETEQKFQRKIALAKHQLNEQVSQQTAEASQKSQQKLTQANQQLEQKIIKNIAQTNQQLTYNNKQLQQKFLQLMEQFKRFQNHQKGSSDKLEKEKDAQIKPINIESIHWLPNPNSGSFFLQGYKIICAGSSEWTSYIFNFKIMPKQSAKFKIKILQTKARSIMIGVLNYTKYHGIASQSNAMRYKGYNGRKLPDGIKEGGGFKTGDDCLYSQYLVNGVLKASHVNSMLTDVDGVFVPLMEMLDRNDKVEWVI